VCCGVSQRVAVCVAVCFVLQCFTAMYTTKMPKPPKERVTCLQGVCVAVCCSVLQCVAVCSSVCSSVRCGVCCSACCSVIQCVVRCVAVLYTTRVPKPSKEMVSCL